jgi:hypothetical protein
MVFSSFWVLYFTLTYHWYVIVVPNLLPLQFIQERLLTVSCYLPVISALILTVVVALVGR